MKIHTFSGTFSVHSKRIILFINDKEHNISYLFPEHNYSHEELNNSLLNLRYEVAADNSYFKVYWDANESVGVVEGYNYEVQCSGYVGELYLSSFSQFVYINREKSRQSMFEQFIVWFLQLLGITTDTQQLVSGQAEMVDAKGAIDGSAYVTTFLTYADDTVDVNASCYLDVWYPNSTQWVDEQQMTSTGSDGRYTYELTSLPEDGLYQMRSYCNGTGLMNRTRYAYANLEVYDDIIMQMIT